MKRILALDLGTKTGVASFGPEGLTADTLVLDSDDVMKEARKTRMDRRCDPRVLVFWEWLKARIGLYDIVVFEDVQFASYTLQVQLWSSLRACVWLAFGGRQEVFIECVPVGTLKLFATGHGNATKEMMASALRRRMPARFGPVKGKACKRFTLFDSEAGKNLTDDAVDAIFLSLWAQNYLSKL